MSGNPSQNEIHSMPTAKQTMVDIITRQLDDASYDALLRELAYARMIQRGLEQSDQGKVISDQEVKTEIRTWFR